MRKWKSHKIVEAEKIARVMITNGDKSGPGYISVYQEPYGPGQTIEVPAGFFARNKPMPGDYLVRYADGYLSWSPKGAFEDGYTEVP